MASEERISEINRRIKSPEFLNKFWSRVKRGDDCWEWQGSRDGDGYGMISIHGKGSGPEKAHRIAFATEQKLERGMEICHSCDNPSCVRPSHLFQDTHHRNISDASAKGRMSVKSKGKSGSSNNQAKLNESQVSKIRELISDGKPNSVIAGRFGVHRSTIYLIRKGKKWQSIK